MIDAWIFGMFAGYLGILLGFRPAMDRIEAARNKIVLLRRDRAHQSKTVREQAVASRATKKKIRHLEADMRSIEAEIQKAEAKLKSMAQQTNRLVVLDERRLPEDQRFIVMITGENRALPEASGEEGNENWAGSMRFLVWAPNLERAIKKAETRYPPSRGFKVEVIPPA